ncbi:MAG: LPS export ABC transporter periplasmic protein LptC [Bacteroidota bacterium]|nr:LPS export ABC transporter periplasmic protein LptC [Bacteroidota bacterium]
MRQSIISFLLIITAIYLFGCSEDKVQPSVNSTFKNKELPTQESWNSTVFFTDSGKTKAVLISGHLRMFTMARETLLDSNIRVNFFNPLEVQTTVLTSKRGRVDDVTQNLYAMDSVVVVNDSGVTITTQELMWRNKDRKIVSDRFVTIVSPNERIEGYGFESDQSLRNYVIYKITYITTKENLNTSK